MNRRGFLEAMLLSGTAFAIAGSGVLMPVRKLVVPGDDTAYGLSVSDEEVYANYIAELQRDMKRAIYRLLYSATKVPYHNDEAFRFKAQKAITELLADTPPTLAIEVTVTAPSTAQKLEAWSPLAVVKRV